MSDVMPTRRIERTENLGDQVAAALRTSIITGEMVPGATYSAPQIASQYGVSATPAREALLVLVREGLLQTVRNKGFRVATMTDHDLDCLVEVRRLLEVPAIAAVARIAEPAQVRRIEPLVEAIRLAVAADDLVGYVEADRRFHASLIDLLDNPVLTATVDALRVKTRLYGLRELSARHGLEVFAEEHGDLLDAVARRDSDRARQIMDDHLAHVRREWASPGGRRPEPLAEFDRSRGDSNGSIT